MVHWESNELELTRHQDRIRAIMIIRGQHLGGMVKVKLHDAHAEKMAELRAAGDTQFVLTDGFVSGDGMFTLNPQ